MLFEETDIFEQMRSFFEKLDDPIEVKEYDKKLLQKSIGSTPQKKMESTILEDEC